MKKQIILLFTTGLILRLAVLYELSGVDPIPDGSDMLTYYNQALLLLQGRWPPDSAFYFHPLMPLLIGLSFKVFGVSTLSPRLLNCLIGALAPVVVAAAAGELFDRKIGLLSGCLFAVYRAAVFHSTDILDVSLSTLLLSIAFWSVLRPSPRRGLLAGLALSLGTLGRATLLVPAVSFCVWLMFRRKYACASILLITVLLCVSPIILRNAYFGYPSLTAHSLPTLWMGNNPYADGVYNAYPGGPSYAAYVTIARHGDWLSQIRLFICNQPLDWLSLTVRKALLFLFMPDAYLSNDVNVIFDGLYHSWVLWILPGYATLAALSYSGLFVLRHRWREFVPLAMLYIPYAVATIAFLALSRFRIPVMPVLSTLSAITLLDIEARLRRSR